MIERIQKQDDRQAQDYLLAKYKEFVKMKASRYFLIGAEKEDMIQEDDWPFQSHSGLPAGQEGVF